MTKSRLIVSSLAAASLLTATACVTDPNTGQKKVSRAAIGTGGGALVGLIFGGLIGGSTGRIIGAGIGGVAGAVIGSKMDRQMTELREKTAGAGVDVSSTDNGKAILVTTPDAVTFDTGSANLRPEFRDTLDKIAASMVQYPDSLIDVYGHTDASESGNRQALSESRARTVADYLALRGVSEARIRSKGFGETMPVADNGTTEGRSRNRRVEIKIVPISQEDVRAAKAASGQ